VQWPLYNLNTTYDLYSVAAEESTTASIEYTLVSIIISIINIIINIIITIITIMVILIVRTRRRRAFKLYGAVQEMGFEMIASKIVGTD